MPIRPGVDDHGAILVGKGCLISGVIIVFVVGLVVGFIVGSSSMTSAGVPNAYLDVIYSYYKIHIAYRPQALLLTHLSRMLSVPLTFTSPAEGMAISSMFLTGLGFFIKRQR